MNVATGRKTSEEETKESGKGRARADAGSGATQPMLDLEFVKGLIEAVDGSGIDSLEITRAGTRVKIAKTPPSAGPAPMAYAPPPQVQYHAPSDPSGPAQGGGETPSGGGEAKAAEPAAEAPASNLVDVKSPMVGTFYRSPAPEAPPYVEEGTRVSKGQTLCILEAMKLMNELESEVEGVVKEILVENSEPVEYGQVLFRIDPKG